MMRFGKRISCLLVLLAATSACTRMVSPDAVRAPKPALAKAAPARQTITRGEVLKIAQAYANATWQCSAKNANDQYNRLRPGKTYQGVVYNWGGWDTVDAYQKKIKNGAVAGTTREEIHKEFAGVDCSGFVSRCWGLTRRRYSTYDIDKISVRID
jgi:cell wall-associated NlpC family hydrolase